MDGWPTWWQTLSELLRFLGVIYGDRMQVSRTANLEFGSCLAIGTFGREFLDAYFCGKEMK